jgi:hypothetical protein
MLPLEKLVNTTGGVRTRDQSIKSRLLYRLSYRRLDLVGIIKSHTLCFDIVRK